jgi:hypothetical protein
LVRFAALAALLAHVRRQRTLDLREIVIVAFESGAPAGDESANQRRHGGSGGFRGDAAVGSEQQFGAGGLGSGHGGFLQ